MFPLFSQVENSSSPFFSVKSQEKQKYLRKVKNTARRRLCGQALRRESKKDHESRNRNPQEKRTKKIQSDSETLG